MPCLRQTVINVGSKLVTVFVELRYMFLKLSHVSSLQGEFSHLVLLAAFDCIDDTKLVKQLIISVSSFS